MIKVELRIIYLVYQVDSYLSLLEIEISDASLSSRIIGLFLLLGAVAVGQAARAMSVS